MKHTFLFIIGIVLTPHFLIAQNWSKVPDQPEELGDVSWMRDYDEALTLAKREKKDVFILFQEIPGCATCRNYGNDLLTHPFVKEALETYFVPLAIYNNARGKDAEILQKFNEPSWNNPVARIINPKSEKDVVKRLNGRYDMVSLLRTIENGILAQGEEVPAYLDLMIEEYSAKDIRETHLSMYCFWSGEKAMAHTDGVIKSQAGWMYGREVVKVTYDANITSPKELFKTAKNYNAADAIFSDDKREEKAANALKISFKESGNFRADKEPKYYITKSSYRAVPMTAYQALKVNALLSERQSPDELLSPRQLAVLEASKSKNKLPSYVDKDFASSWKDAIE